MTDCTSRYLTADGRVLRCGGEGLAHGAHGSSMYACDHQDYDEMADDTGPVTSWDDEDPCAWDAAVDGEDVPARFVGVGSVLRYGHDDFVVVRLDPSGWWAYAEAVDVRRHFSPDDTYELVRAVPPAG